VKRWNDAEIEFASFAFRLCVPDARYELDQKMPSALDGGNAADAEVFANAAVAATPTGAGEAADVSVKEATHCVLVPRNGRGGQRGGRVEERPEWQ